MIALFSCEKNNNINTVSANDQQSSKEPSAIVNQDSTRDSADLKASQKDSKATKKEKSAPDKYLLKIDSLKQETLSLKGEINNIRDYQKTEISNQTKKIDILQNENAIYKIWLVILSAFSLVMLILVFIKKKLFKSKKKNTAIIIKEPTDFQTEISLLKEEIEELKKNLKAEQENYGTALGSILKKIEEQNKPKQPKISDELIQKAENLIKRDRELTELLGNVISNDKELAFYLSLIKKEPKTQQDYDQIVNYEIDFKAKFDFALNSMDLTNQSAYFILKQIAAILRLEIIHPQRGEAFMPSLHAANKDEDDSSLGRGKVVRCEKLGYKNSSTVVQKAKIVISR